MRRIDLRVLAGDVDVAYDRLLPHVRGGLHPMEEGDEVVLVALGERGELPLPSELAELAGDLLVDEPVEHDAGDDLAVALAALMPSWEIAGCVVLRTPAHPSPPAGMLDVLLSRELGFGTGAHPTTRHCIELLLDIDPGGAFADLGCGAGALSIAAFKLGFAPVVGIDLLDRICANAAANGDLNGIDADFLTRDLMALDRIEVRVAAMNVSDLDVHEHLAGTEMTEMEWLIVSGLDHPGRLAHAVAMYGEAGFVERRRIDRHGWPAVLLEAAPRRSA
jgi:ribosomal protein L11 methyltransferase